MIFHDRVEVVMDVPFDPPQYDGFGDETFDHIETTVPAEVFPLDTDAKLGSENIITSRYRILLAPQIDIPARNAHTIRLGWNAYAIDPLDSLSGLRVDGTVERHMLRGRLHHYELIAKNVLA